MDSDLHQPNGKEAVATLPIFQGATRAKYFKLDGNEDPSDILSPIDVDGHGTHTSSTLAGNLVPGASLFGLAKGTARGAVPSARVAAYKVCWASSGCSDMDILAGFDAAINDGIDVISISIGVLPLWGDYVTDSIAVGAFHAMRKGIITVASAGNDGPRKATVANNAPWIFTVAASGIDRQFRSNVVLGSGKTVSGIGVNIFDPKPKLYPLVGGDAVAKNSASPDDARSPSAVIYKSQEVKIPAPFIASFSSRGPNPWSNHLLKPDIAAPGIDILASYTPMKSLTGLKGDTIHSKFTLMSGTSMSCPHVAGVAAYVKSFHPNWSPAAIKSAIMTTVYISLNIRFGRRFILERLRRTVQYFQGSFLYHLQTLKSGPFITGLLSFLCRLILLQPRLNWYQQRVMSGVAQAQRQNRGFADLSLSLIGEALISVSQGWKDNQHIPNAVEWELNRGKKVPRCISLAKSIDPTRLAISVADLNLKLMRLCALPPLNINILSVECLLLGAGTLGCQVARMLMVSE
ncbi:hypothetical protein TEA_016069 [Camellia sinensis var. sinensis]|uniref:Peptidase S8/S53 domain-containing protein n=1 Tax=Camellia sinensis var. sinensis TaxID=542762 RepID=A0A4S4EDH0_CAMSN|nr:hypothetical protein TEA_016069 [Camellia sinensis var. sinensis]